VQEGVGAGALFGSGSFDLKALVAVQKQGDAWGGAHLEGNGVRMRVLEAQRLRDLVLERTWAGESLCAEEAAQGAYAHV
jgi:hypothetical protein